MKLIWIGKNVFQKLLPELGVPFGTGKAEKLIRSAYAFSCTRSLTKTVREGMRIDGLEGWSVLEMPGHAESHIVLSMKKRENAWRRSSAGQQLV